MSSKHTGDEAQRLAERTAAALWEVDAATRGLAMTVEEVAPGHARLAMVVGPQMVNGHGTCHGGFLFTLADSCFGYACNTYNRRAVAQHCTITFVAPARLGDRLVATCAERSRAGRSGIYDVTIARADGTRIAEFRGHSRLVEGAVIPGTEAPDGRDRR